MSPEFKDAVIFVVACASIVFLLMLQSYINSVDREMAYAAAPKSVVHDVVRLYRNGGYPWKN